MEYDRISSTVNTSLPTRECGLKRLFFHIAKLLLVTPHAGVWIETGLRNLGRNGGIVTPHAGVWIETRASFSLPVPDLSLPTRECGLKLCANLGLISVSKSLPTRECGLKQRFEPFDRIENGHSPRGSVD